MIIFTIMYQNSLNSVAIIRERSERFRRNVSAYKKFLRSKNLGRTRCNRAEPHKPCYIPRRAEI